MKKLYGAALKAHQKKVGKRKNPSRRKAPKAPKRRAATQIVVHAANPSRRRPGRRRTRSMVVATNPIRRRRNGPSTSMGSAGGSFTNLKTWEKAAKVGVEVIAGGVAGGAIAAAAESRMGASPMAVGFAELGLSVLSIIAGAKLGYPAIGAGAGAVIGVQGARTLWAAHSTPAAPAAAATDPAAAAGGADGTTPAMAALTMGALADMDGFEGTLDAVQNIGDDGDSEGFEGDDDEDDELDEDADGGDESRIPADW